MPGRGITLVCSEWLGGAPDRNPDHYTLSRLAGNTCSAPTRDGCAHPPDFLPGRDHLLRRDGGEAGRSGPPGSECSNSPQQAGDVVRRVMWSRLGTASRLWAAARVGGVAAMARSVKIEARFIGRGQLLSSDLSDLAATTTPVGQLRRNSRSTSIATVKVRTGRLAMYCGGQPQSSPV